MRTRPMMSMEGTLEVIDLTHVSEEEAMTTLLRELRSRREGRPGRSAGPALVIELGRLNGAGDESPAGAGDGEPGAPRRPRGERARGGPEAAPFSFADLGAVLRQMAQAPGDAPESESAKSEPPAPTGAEDRSEVEQFFARRTVIVEDDGTGKMMAAAMVGFGLGAAAMFVARRFRYVAPPSSRTQRPRTPHRSPEADWQAQLDELARRYTSPGGDEQDDEEPSPAT